MSISFDEVVAIRDELRSEYDPRHATFRRLRDFWFGRYWREHETNAQGISQLFRDLRSPRADIGPDIKVVHNLLQKICVKYQTYLSTLPQIRVYVDPPETQLRREQATKKERYLYGIWNNGQMSRVMGDIAWYLPLFGHAYLGIYPDFERGLPVPVLRGPEHSFPIPSLRTGTSGVIFSWKLRESIIKRDYPGYNTRSERGVKPTRGTSAANPEVEYVEYSDEQECAVWVDGQKLKGVRHDLGFNLYETMKFIPVPDEVWGHGAVEQIVGQVEAGNAVSSLLLQAFVESVFAPLVLESPHKFPEGGIEMGPGAVIGVNEGGKAYYLTPPVQVFDAQQRYLAVNEHTAKEQAGMPEINFGASPASSIVTGKAVNELQGAATGSTIEMVQAIGIGLPLTIFNEKALRMGQRLFRDQTMNLFGLVVDPMAIKQRSFGLTLRGKELIGSTRNEVTFSPNLNAHEKLVMNLQAMSAGLVGKKYSREQHGIPDSEAMDEEILAEVIQDAVVGAIVAELQQAPTPAAAAEVETRALAYLEGQPPPVHPLLGVGAPGAATSAPGAPPAGGGAPGQFPPALPTPPPRLSALPQAGGPALPAIPGQRYLPAASRPGQGEDVSAFGSGVRRPVSLADATAAFQAVSGIQGRVFLVGEIVSQGSSRGLIEVSVTDPGDRQTLSDALPQYELSFHVVHTEPTEPHVEVTPGSVPRRGNGAAAAAPLPVGV